MLSLSLVTIWHADAIVLKKLATSFAIILEPSSSGTTVAAQHAYDNLCHTVLVYSKQFFYGTIYTNDVIR